MWITQGHLRHFRNYEALDVHWVPQKNLIIGKNASGKSNILEAIYCLSQGKSPRTRQDRELIRWGEHFATARWVARSHLHGGEVTVEAQWLLSSETGALKTRFKWNGQPVKSRSEIVGKIPTVTFFLSDLLMLRGTPEDRRNALDSSLVQYDPMHFQRLQSYHRVRQQKSQLLKKLGHTGDTHLFESLNQQLAVCGAQVMLARITYLQQLETLATLRYHELAEGQEALNIRYKPSFQQQPDGVLVLDDLVTRLSEEICCRHAEELHRGQVLVGPHRDDVRFMLNEKDAGAFGSQGQQRSIVLAVKLAEIEVLETRLAGETPILLLDDVMAELDPARQNRLLEHIHPRMQVFLTTTHVDSGLQWFLKGDEALRLFTVCQGQIVHTDSCLQNDGEDVELAFQPG